MARSTKQKSAPSTSLMPYAESLVEHRYAPVALAALYFVVMVWIALKYHVVGDYGVETDFYWSYVPQARHILEGKLPIEDFHGPLYPLVLAAVSLVTSDLFHAGVVLSVLSAAVVLWGVYETVRRLVRADVAAMAVLFVAVNPTFVQYSYTAGTDMFFFALVMTATWALLKDAERRSSALVVSALLFGLAYLTRYNGIFALAGVPAAILLADPHGHPWKERARTAGLFAGVFLLTIAPWGIYALVEKGNFFYNRNYLNIAYEMFGRGKVGWDAYWYGAASQYQSLTQVILADPGAFIATVGGNIADHLVGDLGKLVGWPTGILAVIGTALLFRERPDRRLLTLLLIGASFFALLLLVFYGERFSLYLLPLYVVLALRTLTWPALAAWRLWGTVQIGGVAAVVLVLWQFAESRSFNREQIDSGPAEVVQVGRWFEANQPSPKPGTIVVARKPHIAYYLGMTLEMFPPVTTQEELFDALRRVNASYLYYSPMEAGLRPQFQYLLDPARAPSGLRPLVSTAVPPAVLYRVELNQP
jgi:hypothetical protein